MDYHAQNDNEGHKDRSLTQSWKNANNRIDVCDRKDIREHTDSKVIYQVYPSSFNDSNGDGIGDIKGIHEKLDYIKSLNVDAQWTSPFYPSAPGPEGDGGYAVDNYTQIDPKFGSIEDFKALLKDSHDMDMLQYIDFVMCHTSWSHAWFEESRKDKTNDKADYFVWHDGDFDDDGNPIPPNNWMSVFGGRAWSYDGEREQWYLHHFLDSQPSLNLNNPEVVDKIVEEMRFWLELLDDDPNVPQAERDGVDGFRLDALPFANYDSEFRNNPWRFGEWPFLEQEWWNQIFEHSMCQPETIEVVARIRENLEKYDRKRDAVGEVISGPEGGDNSVPVAASYVDRETGLDYCYTNALLGAEGYPDAAHLRGTISYIEEYFKDGGNCNTVSNHDFSRARTRWVGNLPEDVQDKAYRQMVTMYATFPGSLCIYQGDELGLPQAKLFEDIPEESFKDPVYQTQGAEKSRDGCRTPMPWKHDEKNAGFSSGDDPYLPIPDSHYELAVDLQENDLNSTLNFTRDLFAWRKEQPALIRGQCITIENEGPVLAFIRRSKDQTLLCMYNLSDQTVDFRPSEFLGQRLLDELGISSAIEYSIEPYGIGYAGETPDTQISLRIENDQSQTYSPKVA